jgi:hypothetical protein
MEVVYVQDFLAIFKPNYGCRKDKLLLYLPGQTCPDPLSCPVCAGVLCDPISLPCGHSFCRKCIAKTGGLKSACIKCGAPWKLADCLTPAETGIEESDIVNHLKPNVLVSRFPSYCNITISQISW